jgi:predicted alpha-1,2-mannosidase
LRESGVTYRKMRFIARFREKSAMPKLHAVALLVGALLLLSGCGGGAPTSANSSFQLLNYVNPLIGTARSESDPPVSPSAEAGNTFPGAAAPFGMVQWGPDTNSLSPDLFHGAYRYEDPSISGFSLTHLSGAGCAGLSDLPFFPTISPISAPVSPSSPPSVTFSHSNEKAAPGDYEVLLDNGIRVQLTATPRTGFARFTFPVNQTPGLLIEVGRNATAVFDAYAEFVGSDEIRGYVKTGAFCGTANRYTLYFAARFDQPFQQSGTWDSALHPGAIHVSGPNSGVYATFEANTTATLQVKVGLSYTGIAGAEANLSAESPDWSFEALQMATRNEWQQRLEAILVRSPSSVELTKFYTALYHTFLHPSVFNDVDGSYIGFDDSIHTASGYTHYATFSGWDIYRTQIPLLAFLRPSEASDITQSLVVDSQQSGMVPRWPVANDESGVMVGDPGVLMICNAYAFGARNFDTASALAVMVNGSNNPAAGYKTFLERPGLADYLQYGFIPAESSVSGGASVTLEYAAADFALAQFAQSQGDAQNHAIFSQRAKSWLNVFDPTTGYFQLRHQDGSFVTPWAPNIQTGFVEGNSAQYTWFPTYDTKTLFTLLGGNQPVTQKLDGFFTQLNAGTSVPYAWLGDEPTIHTPWLYLFAGQPSRTQQVLQQIRDQLYNSGPGGLPGNDDLGTMSAWYILSSLGLYPAIPGVGGFVVSSPAFPSATIQLEGGHTLTINAKGAPTLPYIAAMQVNGTPYNAAWIPANAIANGGEIDLTMSAVPTTWGTDPASLPPSF